MMNAKDLSGAAFGVGLPGLPTLKRAFRSSDFGISVNITIQARTIQTLAR